MPTDPRQESSAGEAEFLRHAEAELAKLKETTGYFNWVNTGAFAEVVRMVHDLRGNPGMAGHPDVAAILDGVERKLDQADQYTDVQLREEVHAALRQAVEALQGPSPDSRAPVTQGPSVASGELPQSVLTPAALKRLKPLTILVVDDDRIIRRLLQTVYEKLGMKVITMERGVDLKPDFLARYRIDVVILDLHLPDEDGYSICKRLKADASSCNVPIVFISVTGELESRFYGWQVGAEDFIVKPVDPLELLLRLEFLVERNSAKLTRDRQVGISYDSFLKEIDKRAKGAISGEGTFVLALLSLSGAGADEKQRAAGSRFLLDELRRGDIFCSPRPGYLTVLQPDQPLETAEKTFNTLALRLKSGFRVDCRVGVAQCPTHGTTGADLLAALKAHLDLAVQTGVAASAGRAPLEKTEEPRAPMVVIVDDDLEFLNGLAKPFAELGIHAIMESASERALECIRQNSPDLVILDVLMPDPDGLTILQRLKSDPKLAAIPVIMASPRGAEDCLIRAFDLGAVDYLAKPFRIPEMKARVQRALRAKAA